MTPLGEQLLGVGDAGPPGPTFASSGPGRAAAGCSWMSAGQSTGLWQRAKFGHPPSGRLKSAPARAVCNQAGSGAGGFRRQSGMDQSVRTRTSPSAHRVSASWRAAFGERRPVGVLVGGGRRSLPRHVGGAAAAAAAAVAVLARRHRAGTARRRRSSASAVSGYQWWPPPSMIGSPARKCPTSCHGLSATGGTWSGCSPRCVSVWARQSYRGPSGSVMTAQPVHRGEGEQADASAEASRPRRHGPGRGDSVQVQHHPPDAGQRPEPH